ncbi:hypothetical protein D3C85_1271100 [compost metagenome]
MIEGDRLIGAHLQQHGPPREAAHLPVVLLGALVILGPPLHQPPPFGVVIADAYPRLPAAGRPRHPPLDKQALGRLVELIQHPLGLLQLGGRTAQHQLVAHGTDPKLGV